MVIGRHQGKLPSIPMPGPVVQLSVRAFAAGLLFVAGCHGGRLQAWAPTSKPSPPAQTSEGGPTAQGEEAVEQPEEGECGVERWAIKEGYDEAANHVDTEHPQLTTIDALRALLPPEHLRTSPRLPPTETTTFLITDVRLHSYVREADGDYHMVIADEHGDTMIAEIPAPDCIHKASPWRDVIGRARAAVEANLHQVTARRKAADEVVSILAADLTVVLGCVAGSDEIFIASIPTDPAKALTHWRMLKLSEVVHENRKVAAKLKQQYTLVGGSMDGDGVTYQVVVAVAKDGGVGGILISATLAE